MNDPMKFALAVERSDRYNISKFVRQLTFDEFTFDYAEEVLMLAIDSTSSDSKIYEALALVILRNTRKARVDNDFRKLLWLYDEEREIMT